MKRNKILLTVGIVVILVIAYFLLFAGGSVGVSFYQIPGNLLPGMAERKRWAGDPKTQQVWDELAGNIKGRLREAHTGEKAPSEDPADYESLDRAMMKLNNSEEARKDNQRYYDSVVGQVLGWLKGADLEASGGNVWLYYQEIANYLNSGQALSFEAVSVGQFLSKPHNA